MFGEKRRSARPPRYRELFRRHQRHGLIVLGLVLVAMFALDPFIRGMVAALPRPVIAVFAAVTDYGLSGTVLYPVGLCLIVFAVLTSPALTQMTRGVLVNRDIPEYTERYQKLIERAQAAKGRDRGAS